MKRRATTIEDEVRALAHLDLQGLRNLWSERFGAPPSSVPSISSV